MMFLFSDSADAYVHAVGGGLIFQIGYIIITGILIFATVPFKKISKWFRKKTHEQGNPAERDKI